MTEHKFPHDFEEQEYVDQCIGRSLPEWYTDREEILRTEHRLRSNGIAGILANAVEQLKAELPEDRHDQIKSIIGEIASHLDAPIGQACWVVSEYDVEVKKVGEQITVDEFTRPHQHILRDYWAKVNG